MPATKAELVKKVPCICITLPCVHNPELSDDIKVVKSYEGETTPKGVIYLYIPKDKFLITEETTSTYKVRVID